MKNVGLLFVLFFSSLFGYSATVDTVLVHSRCMNKNIKSVIVLPDKYEDNRDYPVLYLLHGYSDNYSTWIKQVPHITELADRYSFIIVMPDGNYDSWYWDSPVDTTSKYETFISSELIKYVDNHYRTIAERDARAITGNSMGGQGALFLAFRHQDIFGLAGSLSGGVDIRPFPSNWGMAEKLGAFSKYPERWNSYTVTNQIFRLTSDKLKIIIDCGTEDFFYGVNMSLHHKLLERNIPHVFIEHPGKHNWQCWRDAIDYQVLFFTNNFRVALSQYNANNSSGSLVKEQKKNAYVKFDDISDSYWDNEFKIVEIKSSLDKNIQKAYFYKSKSNSPQPLIISLHTWSGYYNQKDGLANLCKQKDLNYIHPDFRGANWTKNACCSNFALNDIDDAITYAINNANVDTTKIFVIGVSGGGFATLSTFMKSKHNISKFSAWASISDLVAWYNECKIRNSNYAKNIMDCTSSKEGLNIEIVKQKSPVYWDTPIYKLKKSKLYIYAGVYDGVQGSVPITHSINFYNKVLNDLSISDTSKYISDSEIMKLLQFRKPLGSFGVIANRKICLRKETNNLSITIFEGNHEMLTEYALNELLEE